MECELRVKGGDLVESSKDSGPIEYQHGSGQMLKGLEAVLESMDVGEEKSGVIPAVDAFGTAESQPKMAIPKAHFPKEAKLEKGARFEAKGPHGRPLALEVVDIEAEQVIARAIHPLADKDIAYTVKVLAVRPPKPPVPKIEEIDAEEDADG
jgi:peptidylprolyl isomerase